jgi:hypothetical protein
MRHPAAVEEPRSRHRTSSAPRSMKAILLRRGAMTPAPIARSGAAVGSGTIAQFVQANGSLDWMAVQDHLDELVPQIAKNLASVAQRWTTSYLADHMTRMFSTKKNLRTDQNDDNEFKAWVRSYEGGQELRRTVWEKFVFPVAASVIDLHPQSAGVDFSRAR